MKLKHIVIGFLLVGIGLIVYTLSASHTPIVKKAPVAKLKTGPAAPWISNVSNPHLAGVLREYAAFINEQINSNFAPGAAVAIVQDTSIIFLKGFGQRNVLTHDSVNVHTVFRIGSVSKCFASTLTGILVDDKLLHWDEPVKKYLPRFRLKSDEHTKGLTIRHLLSHTTGLPYHAFTDRVDDGANFDTLVYHLRDLDLLGRPGQLYSYQNVGYSIISDIIRAASGHTYAENMRDRIFAPLHMETASVSYKEIMSNSNVALPHRFTDKWKALPISSTYYNVAPAGGINASITDMAYWIRSMESPARSLISPAVVNDIYTPQVRATARNNHFWEWKPVRSAWYALGWRLLNFKDDTLAYHGGYVNGFRSEVAIDRKSKFAIVVLVNASGGLADVSIPRFFELYSKHKEEIDKWDNMHRPGAMTLNP